MDFESLKNALYPNVARLTLEQLKFVQDMTYNEMYEFYKYVEPCFLKDIIKTCSMLETDEEVMSWCLGENINRLLGYCGFDGKSGNKLPVNHTDIAPYSTNFASYVIHEGVVYTNLTKEHRKLMNLYSGKHSFISVLIENDFIITNGRVFKQKISHGLKLIKFNQLKINGILVHVGNNTYTFEDYYFICSPINKAIISMDYPDELQAKERFRQVRKIAEGINKMREDNYWLTLSPEKKETYETLCVNTIKKCINAKEFKQMIPHLGEFGKLTKKFIEIKEELGDELQEFLECIN